jgi:hypothetical protein
METAVRLPLPGDNPCEGVQVPRHDSIKEKTHFMTAAESLADLMTHRPGTNRSWRSSEVPVPVSVKPPHSTAATSSWTSPSRRCATIPADLQAPWPDRGAEMAAHISFTFATDIRVYFCDPASPWQRGSNENTDGLLRQYFLKGTHLSVYGPEDLERVAQELNGRPRKTIG